MTAQIKYLTSLFSLLHEEERLVLRCRINVEFQGGVLPKQEFSQWCYRKQYDPLKWDDNVASFAADADDVADLARRLREIFPTIISVTENEHQMRVYRNEGGFKTWRPAETLLKRRRLMGSSPVSAGLLR